MEHIHYEQLSLIDAIAIKKELIENISELTNKLPNNNFSIKNFKENQKLRKELESKINILESKLEKIQTVISKHIYF